MDSSGTGVALLFDLLLLMDPVAQDARREQRAYHLNVSYVASSPLATASSIIAVENSQSAGDPCLMGALRASTRSRVTP